MAGGGLGGLGVVTRRGGGGGTRGTEDSLGGPVSGVASPGSMASSTTGPTTSLNRPPSLLISAFDLKDTTIPSSRAVECVSLFSAKLFVSSYQTTQNFAITSPQRESVKKKKYGGSRR